MAGHAVTALSERTKRNIQWITEYLRVPEGRLVGKPVELSPAQVSWMEMIYGSPTRMFICSIPRKNGKTSFSAMLVLLHLAGPEAVPNGQLFSAAQSRDQAALLFSLAAKMVRMSAELSRYVFAKETAKQLICPDLGTVYKALSADAATAMGLSPTLVIHDEAGQIRGPKSDLFDALETAGAAQTEPMSIIISTQAATDGDLLSMLIDDAMTGADPRVKCVLYSVHKDDDVFDLEVLKRAQPNWHLMNHAEVQSQMAAAKRMPSRESGFRNLVANQRVQAHSPFVTSEVWKRNGGAVEDYDGQPCYGGLDLSGTTDLTAFVVVWQGETGWQAVAKFWTPEASIVDRSKRDRAPYDLWAEQGLMIATPGMAVDYDFVAREIVEDCDRYDMVGIAFDRWRMDTLKKSFARLEVGEDFLEKLKPFGQGFASFAPALDSVEKLLLNSEVRHGMNPVLTAAAANSVVLMDSAGNRKLDKAKSTGRIDGMVALTMALSTAVSMAEEFGSIEQGFVSL